MASDSGRALYVVIPADRRGLNMLDTAVAIAKARRMRLLAKIVEDQRLEATASLPFTRLVTYGGAAEGFDLAITRRSLRLFRGQAERRLHELASQLEWRWAEPEPASADEEPELQVVPFVELHGAAMICSRVTLVECGGAGGIAVMDEGSGLALNVAVELALATKKPLRIIAMRGKVADIETVLDRLRRARLAADLTGPASPTPEQLATAIMANRPAYLVLDRTDERDNRAALLKAVADSRRV